MVMSLIVIFCFFILQRYGANIIASEGGQLFEWNREINESLHRNIKNGCKWQFSTGLTTQINSHDTLLVSKYLPTKTEIGVFQRLTPTLTKGNSALEDVALKKGYGYDKWAGETQIRWEIPVVHPGQNRSDCVDVTLQTARGGVHEFYREYKSVHRTFYVLRGQQAVIHPDGSVAFQCGYYEAEEGCETRWDRANDWWKRCTVQLTEATLPWEALWAEDSTVHRAVDVIEQCSYNHELAKHKGLDMHDLFTPRVRKRVFVLTALWDFNFHHFLAESLARLSRNLRFLRANPDVFIHIRSFEDYDMDPVRDKRFRLYAKKMRDSFFELLGIDLSRLVYGVVVAEEVIIPRALHCSYTLSNPMEIRLLAKELLQASRLQLFGDRQYVHRKKFSDQTLIIQQRYTDHGSTDRAWNNKTYDAVSSAFQKAYTHHNIVRMSSTSIEAGDYCLACEILQYAQADVLVGAHGAGLTAMMFMPPGALVVEIVGDFKDVNMPVCGYYGPLSAVCGHHHYLHAYDNHAQQDMDAIGAARESHDFYNALQATASGGAGAKKTRALSQ